MIREAFLDWSRNPVVTTLDSIASPIDLIQFPTITICDDEYKVPDRWTLIEHLLNQLEFQCYGNCDSKLRKFLEPVLKGIAEQFKQWLFKNDVAESILLQWKIYPENSGLARHDVEIIAYLFKEMWTKYITELSSLKESTLSIKQILNLPSQYIGSGYSLDDIFYYQFGIELPLSAYDNLALGTYSILTSPLLENNTFCQEKKCQSKMKIVTVTLQNLYHLKLVEDNDYYSEQWKLGPFLKTFLGIDKLKMNTFQTIHRGHWDDFLCKYLQKAEKSIHNYFRNLSQLIGFEEKEALSMYDVPEIVGSYTAGNLEDSSLFLLSRCIDNKFYRNDKCTHKWTSYAEEPLGMFHPCVNNEECCHKWTMKLGNNLKAIMKVMRFANARSKSHIVIDNDFQRILIGLNFSLSSPANETRSIFDFKSSIIPQCWINKDKPDFSTSSYREQCNLFQPVITDMGICHAFNPTPSMDMLAASYFTDSFNDAFKNDLIKSATIHNGTGAGEKNSLNFYLLGKNYIKDEGIKTKFFWGLSNKEGYFDMKSLRKSVKVGDHTTLKVQAMEVVPSNDLHDVPIEKRKCRFEDEVEDLIIFKSYSQAACEFEGQLLEAEKVCRCTPWNYPAKPQKGRHTLCDLYGNYCFKAIMEKTYSQKTKHRCLPLCHQIRFTYTENIDKRDEEEICNDKDSVEFKISRQLREKEGYNHLIYKYHKIKEWIQAQGTNRTVTLDAYDGDKIDKERCKFMVRNDVARVTVMFDDKQYVRTMTNLRSTFSERLGTFGKKVNLKKNLNY